MRILGTRLAPLALAALVAPAWGADVTVVRAARLVDGRGGDPLVAGN
jgi:hypothetical protein